MTARRPTINDVAERAGVSKSLVSLALAGSPKVAPASRAAIQAAAEELGYRRNAAARSLAERRTRTVGVLALTLHNPVFAEILDGVQLRVRERGHHCVLVTGDADPQVERNQIEQLLDLQVEGLILIAHRQDRQSLLEVAQQLPITVITQPAEVGFDIDMVSNDDIVGVGLAVDHLVHLGHRQIAHVTGGSSSVAMTRLEGYRRAMVAHGLGEYLRTADGAFSDDGGYRGARSLLAEAPEVTALVVANDIAAIGALAAAEEAGRNVPADLSIICYDGIAMRGLRSIDLTTVAQPLTELGITGANLLMDRIEDPSLPPRQIRLAPQLIVRGSTAIAPANR
ncbi:MAG: LacI family DNA-binding transcriptional regulator [Actinomycetales bacterium]